MGYMWLVTSEKQGYKYEQVRRPTDIPGLTYSPLLLTRLNPATRPPICPATGVHLWLVSIER